MGLAASGRGSAARGGGAGDGCARGRFKAGKCGEGNSRREVRIGRAMAGDGAGENGLGDSEGSSGSHDSLLCACVFLRGLLGWMAK